jgi:intraflagellar transport protein 122
LAKLPYANYLLKNDKYEEALRAFKKISRPDLTNRLINSLSKNAVNEKRFIDASRQYWALAVE